jgi:hypothetical protein
MTMIKKALAGLSLLAAFGISAGPALGQLAGSSTFSTAGTSAEAAGEFLARLQPAVAADRRDTVAGLIEYPISAWIGGRSATLRNRREFLAKYDAIFTKSLKATIAAAKVENSWANWQGVMFDSGRIWLRPKGPNDSLRIVTINAPTNRPSERPPP